MLTTKEQRDKLRVELEWYMRNFGDTEEAMAAIESAKAEEVEQEPVAYSCGRTLYWHEGKGVTDAQLYTSPQPISELSDNRVRAIAGRNLAANGSFIFSYEEFPTIIRAILAAAREKDK